MKEINKQMYIIVNKVLLIEIINIYLMLANIVDLTFPVSFPYNGAGFFKRKINKK